MGFNVVSHRALAFAEALGAEICHRQDSGFSEAVGLDTARALVRDGRGMNVYAHVEEGHVGALLDLLVRYQEAQEEMEEASDAITGKVASERAIFIRKATVDLVAAWTGHNSAVEPSLILKARNVAVEIDRLLWESLDGTEEG